MTASGILDNGPGVRKEKNKLWDSKHLSASSVTKFALKEALTFQSYRAWVVEN